ncbi:SNF2 family N-terminal domain-containing protein [Hypoxylon rubiginosum]|uniref:SNF2 family N-terminal domain-containing protein n=1 Tax=Hypoxylon rubiginosum TaxID=110542 RepID=A0ACB9YJ93_9PEZI|nr:SNF2 family N-terminal domain-containing protein [Hypoxylon rubiginosum]
MPFFNISELLTNRSTSADTASEVCFGTLCDVRIQWISAASRQKLVSQGVSKKQDVYDVNLVLSDGRCEVVDVFGDIVAVLNSKTHLALSKLTAVNQIQFRGHIQRDNLNSTTTGGKLLLNGSSAHSLLDLLVFGPQLIAENLARELSRYRLFLQHPDPLPADVSYSNPQYLPIAGAFLTNGSLLPAIQDLEDVEDHEDTSNISSSQEDDKLQMSNLADVLDHLPQHNYLEEVQVDHRISTPLLSHQKEGVDFILRREYPTPTTLRSLWKLSGFGEDNHTYRHLITGSSSDKPDDIPGGLLADAMGVGKTLTMIASIASSMENANLFVSNETTGSSPDMHWRCPINSTLILVPSALLLDGWIAEIKKHVVPGTLRYYKYHGPNRSLPLSTNIPYQIVLSTYGTVAADSRSGGGVLHSFKWYRLVLDEAHIIRNWSTKQFKAVTELEAVIRWCMTGTPIQNSLEDLASLVRFLQVPLLEDASIFRRHIIGGKKTANGVPKPNYEKLKLLLGSICLRRSASVLSLIAVTYMTCRPVLSSEERNAYNNLALACKMSIDELTRHQYTERLGQRPVLEALLRMRIFCNQGLDITAAGELPLTQADETISLLQQTGETSCAYCNSYIDIVDNEETIYLVQKQSLVCAECAVQYLHKVDQRGVVKLQMNHDEGAEIKQGVIKHSKYSTKLKALLENVKKQDPQEKSIVFSAWIRSLDAVASLFTEHDITFRRVDGGILHAKRKKMLSEFRDPSVRVLLITLGTGAVGLNQLSIANQIHLLEPQWNPSVESQAIGRVIRLDQKKKVTVIRYVAKSTIEESVESKQVSKLHLAVSGGLQSSNSDHIERIEGLRVLAKAIQAQLKP